MMIEKSILGPSVPAAVGAAVARQRGGGAREAAAARVVREHSQPRHVHRAPHRHRVRRGGRRRRRRGRGAVR